MYRFSLKALLIILIFQVQVSAHDIALPVIVDTDMALDDIRAITMLLNSEVARIPLFIVSDGVREQKEGIRNLRAILEYFDRNDVRVVKGKGLDQPAPQVRKLIDTINVPGSKHFTEVDADSVTAPEAIVSILNSIDEPVIYVCLGPPTNIAAALGLDNKIKEKISGIIYYGGHPDAEYPGWNSLRDPESAHRLFKSEIKIYSVILPEKQLLRFDSGLYEKVKKQETQASVLLEKVHESGSIKKLLEDDHFYVWDEMLAIYLNDPSLFSFSSSENGKVFSLKGIDRGGMERAYLKALGLPGDFHLSPRDSVIFTDIPRNPSMFQEDVRPIVEELIDAYGIEEWKACLLTNEFHRHLGIYSLVGAKMGVRAREILDAPFDSLEVISNAGNTPPLSCMNDGLQVSTGASLGRGAIKVIGGKPAPSAMFIYNDLRLTLTLKNEIWEKVKMELRELVSRYGGTTQKYFKEVRAQSVRNWKDLDRANIFNEKMERIISSGK